MKNIEKFDKMIETENKVFNGEIAWGSEEQIANMKTWSEMSDVERFVYDSYRESKKMNNKHIVIELDCERSDDFIVELDRIFRKFHIHEFSCFGVYNLNVQALFGLQSLGWSMGNKMVTEQVEAYGHFHDTDEAPVIDMYKMF